jgi:hypothetical protein
VLHFSYVTRCGNKARSVLSTNLAFLLGERYHRVFATRGYLYPKGGFYGSHRLEAS